MMGLSCASGRHIPSSRIVRNQGFEFSQCRNCACDLIRSNRSWKTVPEGFRVVWRGGDEALSEDPMQLLLDLPSVGRALALRTRDRPMSRLAAIPGILIGGVVYLLWSAKDQIGGWWSRFWSRQARSAVLRLPAP